MKKMIYHGSDKIIEKPVWGFGKTYNDYGLGFYCTQNLDMAKEWSVNYNRDGYVNCYEVDFSDLQILNLNGNEYGILHWLTVLLENREFDVSSILANEAKTYLLQQFAVDYHKADVIIGYRADDSYFSFAQDFLNGTISYRQLAEAMHLGKLGWQVVLKSSAAFEKIRFLEAIPVSAKEWFVRREMRDKNARREYLDVAKNHRLKDDIYITKILDEEMKADDLRLR